MDKAEEYYQNGLSLYKRGELDQAQKSWQACLREDPLHSGAIFHYTRNKDEIEKKRQLALLRKTGERQYATNAFIEALVTWLRVRELDPGDAFARNYLENIDQAFKAGVISVTPGQDDEYFKQGLQAFRQQKYTEAVVYWEVALKLNAGNEQARQGLNKARSTIIQQQEQETQEKQSTINGLLQEGLELYGAGKVVEALKKWITIFRIDLDNKDTLDYVVVARADITASDYATLCEYHGIEASRSGSSFNDNRSTKSGRDLAGGIGDETPSFDMMAEEDLDLQGMADQITDRTKIPKEMSDAFETEMEEPDKPSEGGDFSYEDESGAFELDGVDDKETLDLDEEFTDVPRHAASAAAPMKKAEAKPAWTPPRMPDDQDEMIDDLSMDEIPDEFGSSDKVPETDRDDLFGDEPDDRDARKSPSASEDHLDIIEGDLDDDYELDDEFIEEEEEEEEAIAAVHGTQAGDSAPQTDARNLVDKYFERGFVLYKSRKYEEAIIEWKKIFDIDRGNERAKDYIEKAITLYEASPFIEEHLSQGNTFLADGRFEEAIKEFEKILEIDAELEDATKGIVFARQKLAEVVIPARKSSAPRTSPKATAEEVIADIAVSKKGARPDILKNRSALIGIGAGFFVIIIALGYFFYLRPLQEKNRLQKIMIEKQQALENMKGQIDASIADALVQMNLRNFEQAKLAWNSVLALDPQNERAKDGIAMADKLSGIYSYINAGEKLIEERKFNEALAAFEKALALDPELPATIAKIRDTQEQKQVYDEVKERVNVILEQGKQYFNEKDYDRAIAFFRNALKLLPEDDETKEWIRRAEFEKRRGTNVEANLKLGLSRYESRKYEQAREYFQEVIKLDPDNKDANFYLKKIEEELSLY